MKDFLNLKDFSPLQLKLAFTPDAIWAELRFVLDAAMRDPSGSHFAHSDFLIYSGLQSKHKWMMLWTRRWNLFSKQNLWRFSKLSGTVMLYRTNSRPNIISAASLKDFSNVLWFIFIHFVLSKCQKEANNQWMDQDWKFLNWNLKVCGCFVNTAWNPITFCKVFDTIAKQCTPRNLQEYRSLRPPWQNRESSSIFLNN